MGWNTRTRQKFPLNNLKTKTKNVTNWLKAFPPIIGHKIKGRFETSRPFRYPAIKKAPWPWTPSIASLPLPKIPIQAANFAVNPQPSLGNL